MMENTRRFVLKRGFWVMLALLLIWKGIPSGIYFLLNGTYSFPALFMFLVGIVALFILLEGSLIRKAITKEVRLIETSMPMLLLLIVLLLDLEDAITLKPIASTGYPYWRIHTIGTLILFALLLWQYVASILSKRQESIP